MHVNQSSLIGRAIGGQLSVVLLALALLAPAAVEACEACKDAVKGDPVGTALSATTLLLISMPVLLIGSVGAWIGYVHWRASRAAAAAEQPSEIAQPI